MVDTNHWITGVGVLAALALVSGCEDESALNSAVLHGEAADDDDQDFTPVDDELTFRSAVENGREVNGSTLNSRTFNSRTFNSRTFNGTALGAAIERINGALTAAVQQNAHALTNVQIINGSLLSAFDTVSNGTKIGAQLNDTTFSINFDPLANGGEQLTFKIKSVVQSAVQSDVYFHTVEQLNEFDEFETLCRDGAGNPTQAIALPGTWDPANATRQSGTGKFTWACRGASLAKAVEWGYRPWVSAAMNDAHQAAMRMIRADYCGDGVPHTSNGNPIDISDKWGIQVSETSWDIEAKWGPDGAVCLNTPRKTYWPRNTIPCANTLPACTNNDPAEFGGLLMTRVVPNNDV